jgi:hypothetical protein
MIEYRSRVTSALATHEWPIPLQFELQPDQTGVQHTIFSKSRERRRTSPEDLVTGAHSATFFLEWFPWFSVVLRPGLRWRGRRFFCKFLSQLGQLGLKFLDWSRECGSLAKLPAHAIWESRVRWNSRKWNLKSSSSWSSTHKCACRGRILALGMEL